MTLFDASGTAAGVGTVSVTATLRATGAALLAGLGGVAFTATAFHPASLLIVGAGDVAPAARSAHAAAADIGASAHAYFKGQVPHVASAALGGSSALAAPTKATYAASAPMAGSSVFTLDHFTISATITGQGQVSAGATVHEPAAAALVGSSNTAANARVAHEASAHLAGSSFLGVPVYNVTGVAAGSGTVTGNAFLRLAALGDAVGSGDAHLGAGHLTRGAAAQLGGAATLVVNPLVVREIIMGGQTSGTGTLYDTLISEVSGTAAGSATVTASAFAIRAAAGFTAGKGALAFSEPLPMIGVGNIVAFAEILRVPPPFCGPICGCDRCCGRREEECGECRGWHFDRHHNAAWWWQCRECWERHAWHRRDEERRRHHEGHEWSRQPNPEGLIGDFRWNQTFGRGDLEICLKDRQGNQRGPVFIGYTMFMVSSTGILHQVGPTDRKPAQADVGKFYVTGTAGENGQPGCWAVRWRYQRTYSEPIIEQLQQFRVVDAVLDCDRPDHVRRHCKYGWDL